jgi:hypothetical protein
MEKVDGLPENAKPNRCVIVLKWMPLIVAVLAAVYSIGDHVGWWDTLTGRADANAGLQRLASPKNMPTTLIWSRDREFSALLKLITANATDPEIKNRASRGDLPTGITRMGGTFKVPVGDVPKGLETTMSFAADVSPVGLLYKNDSATTNSGHMFHLGPPYSLKGDMFITASLGDIREWISAHKERERFWVSTVLLGMISILVTLLELTKPKVLKVGPSEAA